GTHRATPSVLSGRAQSLTATAARDPAPRLAAKPSSRRSRDSCEALRVRRPVCSPARRIDGSAGDAAVTLRRLPRVTVLALVRGYQLTLSHLVFTQCRFEPSCSRYPYEAVERYGALRGTWLGIRRILKCHPFHAGGYDPVPLTAGAGPGISLGEGQLPTAFRAPS